MTTEIFTKVTLGITELKVNPMQVAEHDMVCVLSRSKPAFYTVSMERMEELLAAEEQFENGYMVQKDIALKTNLDCGMPITDREMVVNYLARNIKVGDTVRVKSLDKTREEFGVAVGMLSIGDKAVIEDAYDCQVCIGIFDYHIDDLELIK